MKVSNKKTSLTNFFIVWPHPPKMLCIFMRARRGIYDSLRSHALGGCLCTLRWTCWSYASTSILSYSCTHTI